ncbi:unnamed protein product [Paramecium octaurelia]|uniref:Uncharacterized protein n=1 Tax=Paramecium octaurelia TaxID=43137 RepID=A0A8S1SSM0_PAROT|nr:unnamed protein product [Paramecium octaurelia]CAD8141496.1 unnamed protein product [Paramecium octaurelia]
MKSQGSIYQCVQISQEKRQSDVIKFGISFNSIYLQNNKLESSLKSTARKSEWLYLNNQGVSLLSLTRRKQQRLDSIDNEIPIEKNDFYGLNKVYS